MRKQNQIVIMLTAVILVMNVTWREVRCVMRIVHFRLSIPCLSSGLDITFPIPMLYDPLPLIPVSLETPMARTVLSCYRFLSPMPTASLRHRINNNPPATTSPNAELAYLAVAPPVAMSKGCDGIGRAVPISPVPVADGYIPVRATVAVPFVKA